MPAVTIACRAVIGDELNPEPVVNETSKFADGVIVTSDATLVPDSANVLSVPGPLPA